MRLNKRITVAALAVSAVLAAAALAPAQNAKLDFKLVNRTGIEIHAVYLGPHDSDDWGDDVLGRDTLANGESVDIEFSPKTKDKIWDLRIEDGNEKHVEWESLDLTQIEVLTLKIVKGKGLAEWK